MAKNGNVNGKMNKDQLGEIADVIATKVTQDLQDKVQSQIESALERHNEKIENRMKMYFGDMTPTQHTIQHNTMNRLLDRIDNFSHTFFTTIISKVAGWIITLVIIGFVVYSMRNGTLDIFK